MPSAEPSVRYRIGVDENGLGPRLGPMVVTAVLSRVTAEGWPIAASAPRGALAERLGDSKQLVAHGDVALGEAWARALVARGCGCAGTAGASTVDELLHAVSLDDRAALRAPCPGHVEEQCWSAEGESFTAPDALLRAIGRDLDKLAEKGVEIVAVRSILLCAKQMNDGARAGKNRFVLDLHAMERLIVELGGIAGAEVVAVCGKVGGFGKYGSVFGPLAGRLHLVVEESRARSAYHFPGLGEIAFVRDSDASDLCVAMASMVGKYVREAMMGRVARHYQRAIPGLHGASGYYDPVTTAFIEATRLVRDARGVPDECFERRTAEGSGRRTAEGSGQHTAESSGKRAAEGSGKRAAKGSGQRTTEGSGRRAAKSSGQRAAEGSGRRTAESSGQRAAEGSGRRAAAGRAPGEKGRRAPAG